MLHYDPETGVFTWKVNSGRNKLVGQPAGCIHRSSGTRIISINGKQYQSSMLVYVYMTGNKPDYCVYHLNEDKADDRWSNLGRRPKAEPKAEPKDKPVNPFDGRTKDGLKKKPKPVRKPRHEALTFAELFPDRIKTKKGKKKVKPKVDPKPQYEAKTFHELHPDKVTDRPKAEPKERPTSQSVRDILGLSSILFN